MKRASPLLGSAQIRVSVPKPGEEPEKRAARNINPFYQSHSRGIIVQLAEVHIARVCASSQRTAHNVEVAAALSTCHVFLKGAPQQPR